MRDKEKDVCQLETECSLFYFPAHVELSHDNANAKARYYSCVPIGWFTLESKKAKNGLVFTQIKKYTFVYFTLD